MDSAPRPSSLMIRFLTVCESGGTAGLDQLELSIAVAVGLEYGWLLSPAELSPAGRAFTSPGTAVPEFLPRAMPPLMQEALLHIGERGMGHEEFETTFGLPMRSAKVVFFLAKQMGLMS